jgi:integrase
VKPEKFGQHSRIMSKVSCELTNHSTAPILEVELWAARRPPAGGIGEARMYIIVKPGDTPVVRHVKSDAGDRLIPLGPKTIDVLQDYLDTRHRWQQVSASQWPDSGLFFVRPDGQPWHPQTVSRRFDHLITTSGLPPVRLHDLRHCAATYLRHGGADLKEVQETLGHATLALTSDTYTSVILELQRSNADAAADLIPRTDAA